MNPLIFFVHVPKTAGSTVNAHLKQAMPNGRAHCEAIINNPAALKQAAESMDWLSGHVDLTRARNNLSAVSNRPVRYFACLREPTKHVRSHYNWLIEIFHRGESFYENHPAVVKEISARIRGTDNSDPLGIIANLKKNSMLFLNFQSRISLGNGFRWNSGALHQQLDTYEMIACEDGLGALIERMTGSPVSTLSRANEARYHFDPAVFQTPELQEFLKRNNTLDDIIYHIVRNQRTP